MKAGWALLTLVVAGTAQAGTDDKSAQQCVPGPLMATQKVGKFITVDCLGRIASVHLSSGRSVELSYKSPTSRVVLAARVNGGQWLPPRPVSITPCQLDDRDGPNFCGNVRQQLPATLQPRMTQEDEEELQGAFSDTVGYAGAGYGGIENPDDPDADPFIPTAEQPTPPPPPPKPCKQRSCDIWGQTIAAACQAFNFILPEGPPIAAACSIGAYFMWLGCTMVCEP